jgi:mRNA interferase HigB
MRIVSFKRIKEFSIIYNDAEIPLDKWYHITEKCSWNNINDIKKTFANADYIGNDRYVFNIKGNSYRLVAIIIFASKKVYIRFIGTHQEYGRINCNNI